MRRFTVFGGVLLSAVLLGGCGKKVPDLVTVPLAGPEALLISNVSVLDVKSGRLKSGRDVLVMEGRIKAIADAGEAGAPTGAQVVNGQGATLLPGLIDMHGHIGNGPEPSWLRKMPDPERNLQSYLYSGVTTVLDPADLSSQAFARRDKVARGELPGPRIYTAGPMLTAKGGHPVALLERLAPWWIRWYLIPRFARQVDSAEEARAAVREIAGMGADVIKLSVDRIPEQAPRIRKDILNAAGEEAKALGIRTVAHIGTVEDAVDAADAGTSLWVHGVYKERIPDGQIRQFAAYGIPMVATMWVFESYALLGQGERVPTRLERETVAPEVLDAFNHVPETEAVVAFRAFVEKLRTLRPVWRENLRRLRRAGVVILAGSDTQSGVFPGPGLHRELQLLTEAGLTPAEAIRAATYDAAVYLANGQPPEFGIVEEGLIADLLLVNGDPTENLEVLADIRMVIQGGVPVERKAAY